MNIIIHRGAKEIGGSCIELQSGNTRIILDIGLPLQDESGLNFDFNKFKNLNLSQLLSNGILPHVKGLYKNDKPEVDAVLISHPHQDHFGLMQHIHEDIPIYMSKGTEALIKVTGFFNDVDYIHKNHLITPWETFPIGSFNITPYLVDHSGFDALAFLIEAEDKRVFYSGDFRTHGRKWITTEKIISDPPKNIDYLLLEGTHIDPINNTSSKIEKTEENIEKDLLQAFTISSKLILISFSSQNIDRLVSVYKACRDSKRTLVIDPYTAYILDQLKPVSSSIPQFNWNNIKIFFTPNSHTKKLAKTNKLWKYKNAIIKIEEIVSEPSKFVIKTNALDVKIFTNKSLLKNAELIYSQWEGYFKKEEAFWKKHSVPVNHIHTSGHAFIKDLKRFADALNPNHIIPIHTQGSDKFSSVFTQPILKVSDGVKTSL